MLKLVKFSALGILATAGLFGCAAIPLSPQANRVIASKSPAPKGCKYLGSLVGSQGGALVGAWTSNARLAEGAMNDLKNKASNMGANYVQIEGDRAGMTGSGYADAYSGSSSLQQTDVTFNGNAYRCDPREIGLD